MSRELHKHVVQYPLQKLLTVQEAATLTGLSPHTIRAWARRRKIPFRRLGRRMLFHPDDLAGVIEAALVPAVLPGELARGNR